MGCCSNSRVVKGDRLKICCISFVGSNPTCCMGHNIVRLLVVCPGLKQNELKNYVVVIEVPNHYRVREMVTILMVKNQLFI